MVRGVTSLPPPHFAIYREASLATIGFELVDGGGALKSADPYHGIGVRLIFVPR